MEFTFLGNSDLRISRTGMGGCPLGGHGWGEANDELAEKAVRTAFESGINFFDTADVYGLGHSEELLSRALGEDRHHVVIASKFGVKWNENGECCHEISPKYLRIALQRSLNRLRLERIPLYYIHWPDRIHPLAETMVELVKCRDEGLIGAIGLSNVTASEIEECCQVGPVSAVQIQFSLVDREHYHEIRETVQKWEISLVTWGSLAQGLLTGKYDENSHFESNDRRSRQTYLNFHGEKLAENMKTVKKIKEIAVRMDKKPSQIALRWLLDTPGVSSVLFGAKNPDQVTDNVGSQDWIMNPNDYRELTELFL